MIYVDPTEVREGTRLPEEIVEIAQPVNGLEAATGADILIAKEGLQGRDVTKMPWRMKLREYLQDGFLIQRKSGQDFVNSIPHLGSIFQRMQLATEGTNCWIWLLTVGSYGPANYDKSQFEYEGRSFDTNWLWAAVQGSIDMWQLRGGYIHNEPGDHYAAKWLMKWDRDLPTLQKDLEKTLGPRSKARLEGGAIDPKPWRMTLESFPGVGSEMSYRIADRCDRLADALAWMTWGEPKLEGVGKATLEKWRKWFGLQEGEVLSAFSDVPLAGLNSGSKSDDGDAETIRKMKEKLSG